MAQFLAMGGYATYVWTAFAVTTMVLVVNLVTARRRYSTTKRRLTAKLARQAAAGEER